MSRVLTHARKILHMRICNSPGRGGGGVCESVYLVSVCVSVCVGGECDEKNSN